MTADNLKQLLSFEPDLNSVTILSQRELNDGATYYLLSLDIAGEEFIIPVVHYDGEDWLFTPRDWQTASPNDDIESVVWRVNNTAQEGVVLNSQPRLFV